ncbi:MAG TPA: hypothetical protein VGM03_19625, partial [Phycisphaerae bacterium]
VPGHLYIASAPPAPCGHPDGFNDRIYDVDPVTGLWQIFTIIPNGLCGIISGLAFTPDGTRLRTANYWTSQILEIDGDGNVTAVLGPPQGIAGPDGNNGLAYDAAGDFFVANSAEILDFPAAGGTAIVFASPVLAPSSLAFAPNGDLYAGHIDGVTRFAPDGTGTPFAPFLGALVDVNQSGDAFILAASGLYRYPGGDPNMQMLLTPRGFLGTGDVSMALSPDEQSLYVANGGRLWSVDVGSGALTLLINSGTGWDDGMAVFVPEPGSLSVFFVVAVMLCRSRPPRSSSNGGGG